MGPKYYLDGFHAKKFFIKLLRLFVVIKMEQLSAKQKEDIRHDLQ